MLSPDFFVVGGAGPEVNPYRVDSQARAGLAVGAARPDRPAPGPDRRQRAAVAAAEQAALPILRDALLADFSADRRSGDVGEADVGAVLRRHARRRHPAHHPDPAGHRERPVPAAGQAVRRAGRRSIRQPPGRSPTSTAFTSAWAWMGEWAAGRRPPRRSCSPSGTSTRRCWFLPLAPTSNRHWPSCSTACGAADRSAALPRTSSAAQYVTAQVSPPFTYRDPLDRVAHQTQLRDRSAQTPEPATGRSFWAVPMLLAQRLQSAGDFQAALDWYWILYPYDVSTIRSPSTTAINTETPFGPDLTFPSGLDATAGPVRAGRTPARPVHPVHPAGDHPLPRRLRRRRVHPGDRRVDRHARSPVRHGPAAARPPRASTAAARQRRRARPGDPGTGLAASADQAQLAKLRQGRNIAGIPRTQGVPTTGHGEPAHPVPVQDAARPGPAARRPGHPDGGRVPRRPGEVRPPEPADAYDALKAHRPDRAPRSPWRPAGSRRPTTRSPLPRRSRTKADVMVPAYADAINAPPNQYEQNLLGEYSDMRDVQDGIAVADTAIGIAQAASKASSLFDVVTSFGVSTAFVRSKIICDRHQGWHWRWSQNDLEAQMQANQLQAGIEQRTQEWRMQQAAAAAGVPDRRRPGQGHRHRPGDDRHPGTGHRHAAARPGGGDAEVPQRPVHQRRPVPVDEQHPRRGVPVLPPAGHRHRPAGPGPARLRAGRTGADPDPRRLLAVTRAADRELPPSPTGGPDRRRAAHRGPHPAGPVRLQHRTAPAQPVPDLLPRPADAGGVPGLPPHRNTGLRHARCPCSTPTSPATTSG